MSEWRELTIQQIASPDRYSVVGGPFGSALGRKDYVEDGVPVIRGAQLGGPTAFSHDDLVFVTDEKADQHQGNLAYPGDILVTQRGTVGQVGRIPAPAPFSRYLLSQSQMKLTVNPEVADGWFVYYCLLSPEAQQSMVGATISAGVPHINLATFKSLRLRMPRLSVQRAIAGVLRGLDDLIENNRRRIELLEQMAQAIYREWFVRFRYPGHEDATLVDSPLGRIPCGWAVNSVADIASSERNAVTGGPFGSKLGRKDYLAIGVPVLRGANLRVGGGFDEADLVFVSEEKAGELRACIARRGDVVVTQRGTLGQVGLIPMDSAYDRYVLSQSQMKFTVDALRGTAEYFYVHMRSAESTERFVAQAMVAGVPHVNLGLLREFKVLVPPLALQVAFTEVVQPIFNAGWLLQAQTRAVVALRDALLPRLVTGRIDVSALDLDVLVRSVA